MEVDLRKKRKTYANGGVQLDIRAHFKSKNKNLQIHYAKEFEEMSQDFENLEKSILAIPADAPDIRPVIVIEENVEIQNQQNAMKLSNQPTNCTLCTLC